MALSTEPFRKFVAIAGILPPVERDLRRRIERAYGSDVWTRFTLENLVGRPTSSLLVIHDRDDRDVSIAEGEALVAAWPGAELWLTSGLGHRRILRDAEVIRRAIEFVDQRAARAARSPARS
jgi:pimeloyl-ACP methyl ester carboxylesterase